MNLFRPGSRRVAPPSLRADGRHLVGAGLGQISGREEEKCVVSSQIAVEDAAILRGDDLEAAGPPNVCEARLRAEIGHARSDRSPKDRAA